MSPEIERVFRCERPRILASLARRTHDLTLAEDAVQSAFEKAVSAWAEAVPDQPAAWIATVARNAALDQLRHRALSQAKHAELAESLSAWSTDTELSDDRLRLLFACCHPALAEQDRLALALHTLLGVDVPAIARLFFASESAMAQRLVRAKRKIEVARIPFEIPAEGQLDARIGSVLHIVYLFFTEGFASREDGAMRPEIAAEAIRLGRLVCQLCPQHAEARGLLALMLLHAARSRARSLPDGTPVPLDEQDRTLWDRATIAEGERELDDAITRRAPGPFQMQAAIAALHATAPSTAATDWTQIAALYRSLLELSPSPSAALGLSLAEGFAVTPEHGLSVLAALEARGELANSHRVAATRAELLRQAQRFSDARTQYALALAEARTSRERAFLERRLARLPA